jgi:D-sedoheptulose 7-phosphate isomerase
MDQNAQTLLTYLKQAKRVYICGNGGSAANANHIANDLISCGIKAQSLTADVATLTAIGNDYGYEFVFSRQLDVLGDHGDLLIALSGSGNSQNIVEAANAARLKGIKVFAITGAWNCLNNVANLAHIAIGYGENMQVAEDYQVSLVHQVYRALKGFE